MDLDIVTYDLEVYTNYFDAAFLNTKTNQVQHFELMDEQTFSPEVVKRIMKIMKTAQVVGFNSLNYDLPVLSLALQGATPKQLKALSDKIIDERKKYWMHDHELIKAPNHIDIIEVAPGRKSLKDYSGCLHAPKMQDLPIEPSAIISNDDAALLRKYCENDLYNTYYLYQALSDQIDLRREMSEMYGKDLRSKSDAQIAEVVIRDGVSFRSQDKLSKPEPCPGFEFQYDAPDFLTFKHPSLVNAFNVITKATFVVNIKGSVNLPKPIEDLKIEVGNSKYTVGIGGLHSKEHQVAHHSDEEHVLIDRDVASYYPSLILNGNYGPPHLAPHFMDVYRSLVDRRLAAKHAGDKVTADSLKITINGTFGKMGSQYSLLYAPKQLIQTTLTGQLSLLMLIEMLEAEGIAVVSANTDGVVVKCPRDLTAILELIIWEWEARTGLKTEETIYKSVYSRDVNNYIAMKENGEFKLKGAYAPTSLSKNPASSIVVKAVLQFLESNTPIAKTITSCTDIRMFLNVRKVKGGAIDQDGKLIGKSIRWYYSTEIEDPIRYAVNNYKVPLTEGARPLMELPDSFPTDINYTWYIDKAEKVLGEIAATGAKAA